ncbi:EpsG family protein [Oceanobacillus arenosus]|uniref:EpsG family protein n=1 Tax=Oceanobacillus arenosus TaxID=1229153 RepID=UPI00147286BC|nr:EpsG family protein [Oceanobacillus arenosus]
MTTEVNYLVIISIIILIALLVPFESHFNKYVKYSIVIVSLLPLSIIASIRSIGTDTTSYQRIFINQDIINFSQYSFLELFSSRYEPGFLLIISILKSLSLDYRAMFFVFFLIPIFLIIYVVNKAEIKNILLIYTLFLLAYLLKGPMDIIRHFFAAALYLSALLAIAQRKKLRTLLNVGLASIFHYSSLVIFAILPFFKIKWTTKRYLFFLIVAFLSGTLLKGALSNGIPIFTDSEFAFIEKAQLYVSSEFSSENIIKDTLLNFMMIMPVVLNILIALFGLKLLMNVKDNFISILLKAQIMGTLISVFLMSTGSLIAGYRMDFLLSIGNFLLMYYIISYSKQRNQIYVFLLFIYYLIAYNIVLIIY